MTDVPALVDDPFLGRPGERSTSAHVGHAALPAEIVGVWLLFTVVTAEVVVTYARLPASKLYNVSASGLEGGVSRALVFLNFPTALVAIAVAGIVAAQLAPGARRVVAVTAIPLCAAVAWPGVVSQENLDADLANALPAFGVGIAFAISVALALRSGVMRIAWEAFDAGRLALAAAAGVLSIPWFAADLGFYLDGVPLLGNLFQTGALRAHGVGAEGVAPAVHYGHHHGGDGFLLVVSALLLWRALRVVRSHLVRALLSAYLALMLSYGTANLANDLWLEQIVKRGWVEWQIPNVLEPRLTIAWAMIVLGAATIWIVAGPSGERKQ